MNENIPLPVGHYRHYKGYDYAVLGVARHSETLEEFVVYRQEYGARGLWVRPKGMFLETVMVDGHEVRRFQPVSQTPSSADRNLFAELPLHVPNELVQTILTAANVRIERIVSRGHASPAGYWYDQDEHEWIVVLKGAARLTVEDNTIELNAGDHVNLPAHQKHRVAWTTPDEPTVWLAVFYR